MVIGLLTVRLHIPASNSLKTKRRVIKSLKDRLRNRFNISISEIDNHEKWQLADIAIASVSNDGTHVNSALCNILNFIEDFREIDLVDHHLEML